MIAVFFAVLWRSTPRAEMRWWVYAWSANFVALAVTMVFWYLRSRSGGAALPTGLSVLVRLLYIGPKTLFLLLLLRGTWTLRGRVPQLLQPPYLEIALVVFTVGGCILSSTSVDRLGMVETAAIIVDPRHRQHRAWRRARKRGSRGCESASRPARCSRCWNSSATR